MEPEYEDEENEQFRRESMAGLFNRLLRVLPVDVSAFVEIASYSPPLIFSENTADRLVVILLNEQDLRISDKNTKLQVIDILKIVTTTSREYRMMMRIVLQKVTTWFDDEVDPEVRERTSKDGHGELLPVKDPDLTKRVKLLFALCWRTPQALLKPLVLDETVTIEQVKTQIIRNYAATAVQAIIRSKFARKRLYKSLQVQSEEQELEVRNWSILILQKVARGYIARKTVLKSMKIRQTLSKEVLRIAERYLQHGDLWGFLKDINDELKRSNDVIAENQAREDNWAANFVEKVIHKRQTEFNASWETFPKALQDFTGKANSTGALLTKQGMARSPAKQSTAHHSSPNIVKTTTMATATGASMETSQISPTKSLSGAASKILRTNSTASAATLNTSTSATNKSTAKGKNSSVATLSTTITAEEVSGAMNHDVSAAHLAVPGALMRKALGTTVEVEVAEQLNKLINGQYRSRKLVKDIRDVYGPLSDPTKKAPCNKTLAPIVRHGAKPTGKKKKRVGIDGKPIQDVGRMDAAQLDWMSTSGANDIVHTLNKNTSAAAGGVEFAVEPGISLLIDIPQGLSDTIERLMHAAALRCYVPDFFQGVSGPDMNEVGDSEEFDESLPDEEIQARLAARRRQNAETNVNANADYAYQMYLKMPFGLAKMRYEVQCKKWSQGPINRLRLKGLSFLADVSPVSKFVMCMKSVETPRVLLNKCVDIYLELKKMGKQAVLGNTDTASVEKFHRSVHTDNVSTSMLEGSVSRQSAQQQLTQGQLPQGAEDSVLPMTAPPSGRVSPVSALSRAGSFSQRNLSRDRSASKIVHFNEGGEVISRPQSADYPGGSMSSLRTGEVGFDSLVEGGAEGEGSLARVGSASGVSGGSGGVDNALIPGLQEMGFEDTVAGRAAYRKAAKVQSELPNKMLLSMVENRDKAHWCDLKASVEDIFLQAAFLVVPHVSYVSGSDRLKGPASMVRVESAMGNAAFKLHTAALLKMTSEDAKREAVKERFRAAFIMTTPFTLYLKSKRVYTVDDLLRVNLHDLQMPPALETQLEVLLTAVVAKCVDARIVPVAREHVATAAEMFTVPMFYDPKFQRSPFDPFGRPPRLQQKGHEKIIQKKLKAQEKKDKAVNKAHNNLSKVASTQSIQEDLNVPVSLWTTSKERGDLPLGPQGLQDGMLDSIEEGSAEFADDSVHSASKLSLGGELLDDSVLHGKWSFHADGAHASEALFDNMKAPGSAKASSRLSSPSKATSENKNMTAAERAEARRQEAVLTALVKVPSDHRAWTKTLRSNEHMGKNSIAPSAKPKATQNEPFVQGADLMTRTIEDKIFKHSFVCTHPHCGQVFARQYTYNIHLKSHELFGQYHDFKRQPQLFLDKDRSQINATAQSKQIERISLPPVIQAELFAQSMSR